MKFRAKLPAATVTAHQTVLIQVQVQANGVHANVSWMINGQPIQDTRQDRYEIQDSHARDPMVYSTNSTLVIHEITDEDTTAMITACASLGDTMEDQSTTRLIVVRKFKVHAANIAQSIAIDERHRNLFRGLEQRNLDAAKAVVRMDCVLNKHLNRTP